MSCIVDENTIQKLAVRYMGIGKALDRDETEILLFALYCESDRNGGIIHVAMQSAAKQKTRECCLEWEGDKFPVKCRESVNGKHRLVQRKLWFAVIVDDWWSVSSDRHARQLFFEAGLSKEQVILVSQFSDDEIAALREGRAELFLGLRPTADERDKRKAGKS